MSEVACTVLRVQNTEKEHLAALEAFIVRAKAASYVGGGAKAESTRAGSHDVTYAEPGWEYRDSYFGGTDFVGQEVVWHVVGDIRTPVWAMNYYGRVLRDDLFDAATGGRVIQEALSALYREGRFLGGFRWQDGDEHLYEDTSTGDHRMFTGRERIVKDDTEVYTLDYHGGLIRE
ncbi:hypothetical protein GCM10017596_26230 [Microbacterium keratanolyticum]|uniref:DUF5680 domain-containing protein n=1 Tax=Microbacterium keratanolyticum TaxID=67574 RepID=A0A9W6HTX9_9MICO|nr:hypothetical protein GCM10017596_26230 [Microbacterium keratanolyticum]